jgi:hypothetical protein
MMTIAPPEDQVEMAGDPLGIMDRGIELVAHIDKPAGAPETEHDKRERSAEHDGVAPRQRRQPPQHAFTAAHAPGDLHRCAHREHGQQGWQRDERGEYRVQVFGISSEPRR